MTALPHWLAFVVALGLVDAVAVALCVVLDRRNR